MFSQGQYFNPLVPVYLFPRGDDIRKYEVYERYNAARIKLSADQQKAAAAQARLADAQRVLAKLRKSVEGFAVEAYQGQVLDTTVERLTGYTVDECLAMPDYPAHLASYYLIATDAKAQAVSSFYSIQWAWIPNLAGEILIPLRLAANSNPAATP